MLEYQVTLVSISYTVTHNGKINVCEKHLMNDMDLLYMDFAGNFLKTKVCKFKYAEEFTNLYQKKFEHASIENIVWGCLHCNTTAFMACRSTRSKDWDIESLTTDDFIKKQKAFLPPTAECPHCGEVSSFVNEVRKILPIEKIRGLFL